MPKTIDAEDDEAVTGMRLVKAPTFELDPDKFYVIIIDRRSISREDMAAANQQLGKQGIHGLTLMLTGDPGTVRIIETDAKAKK